MKKNAKTTTTTCFSNQQNRQYFLYQSDSNTKKIYEKRENKMTDKIIEHTKQAYMQHVVTHKTYPYYNSDYLNNFVDYEELTSYLEECEFNERFKHIQRFVQPLIVDGLIDFNEFIEIITDDKRFIHDLVLHYSECIYEHVADNYCNDKFVYEDEYAQYKIEDTKELVKIIQLIAEFEE